MLLHLQKISKSFGTKHVLKNLSLEVKPQQIVGLIGKSGCGKSTLLNIIVGLHQPDAGKIMLGDQDSTHKQSVLKHVVGYTTQEGSFYDNLTIRENLAYYANLYNVPSAQRSSRIAHLLESVALTASKDTLAGNISGGMKRRLDFALSLVHSPRIVILDEPTTGLDPVLVKNFWTIVGKTVKEQKISVLVSSHILSEIQNHCTHLAIMHQGSIAHTCALRKTTKVAKLFEDHAV